MFLLPDDTRRKLGSIAGLLGSDFPGERSNAAAAATKLLRQHGLSWRSLIDRALAAPPPWREQLRECHLHADRLSDWERGFVDSLRSWRGPLTERQRVVLARVYAGLDY